MSIILGQLQSVSTATIPIPEQISAQSNLMKQLYDMSIQLAASLDNSQLYSKGVVSESKQVAPASSIPNTKELKKILQFRSNRRNSDTSQFLDWPAWDMLLDLIAVQTEGREISVSAVCISSGAPQSTALRKLSQLETAGLIRRYQHHRDRRRICVVLTEEGSQLVIERLQEDLAFYRQLGK